MLRILYVGLFKCLLLFTVDHCLNQMLPLGGQGSNQAMEDGCALGCLLKGVENATTVPSRLVLLDRARRNRASRVQILSKVLAGKEKEVEHELKQYLDTADSGKHVGSGLRRVEKRILTRF